jgi:hypothetical protein
MIKEALEHAVKLGTELTDARYKVEVVEIDGRKYTQNKGEIKPVVEPRPDTLALDTLTGLADYLNANPDQISLPAGALVIVDGPTVVRIVSPTRKPWRDRENILKTECDRPLAEYGRYMDLDAMILMLKSRFEETEDLAAIVSYMGNISDGLVRNQSDDGVSQTITVRVGITKVENVTLPSRVTLAPFRTFPEIDQPTSPFVFRMKSGAKDGEAPSAALFEADGGAWRQEARRRIMTWLKGELPTGVAILA